MLAIAIIIGLSIIISQLPRLYTNVRPERAFAQVSVGGNTDSDGEAFQATVTLFPGQSFEEQKTLLLKAYALKEWRLQYQNLRMLKIQAQNDPKAKARWDEAVEQGLIPKELLD